MYRMISPFAAAALLLASPTLGQEVDPADASSEPDCEAMISELETSLASDLEKREAMRDEMQKLAEEMPLLVKMADGGYVWLGSGDEPAEPIESWFVSDEVVRAKQAKIDSAKGFDAETDDQACMKALSEEG